MVHSTEIPSISPVEERLDQLNVNVLALKYSGVLITRKWQRSGNGRGRCWMDGRKCGPRKRSEV